MHFLWFSLSLSRSPTLLLRWPTIHHGSDGGRIHTDRRSSGTWNHLEWIGFKLSVKNLSPASTRLPGDLEVTPKRNKPVRRLWNDEEWTTRPWNCSEVEDKVVLAASIFWRCWAQSWKSIDSFSQFFYVFGCAFSSLNVYLNCTGVIIMLCHHV